MKKQTAPVLTKDRTRAIVTAAVEKVAAKRLVTGSRTSNLLIEPSVNTGRRSGFFGRKTTLDTHREVTSRYTEEQARDMFNKSFNKIRAR